MDPNLKLHKQTEIGIAPSLIAPSGLITNYQLEDLEKEFEKSFYPDL